jgi:thiol-disulfide isomerase/thioredoxin
MNLPRISYLVYSLSLVLVFTSSQTLWAQESIQVLDQVNEAVGTLSHLHFKTTSISKYYTESDTNRKDCETWLLKTKKDKVLGMHIRAIEQDEHGKLETFHKGITTWVINHNTDTIVKYNQSKGHWNGFNGNTKTDWTTQTPLTMGIRYEEGDSMSIKQLKNGDWFVQRFSPDIAKYGIVSVRRVWWVDDKTMLPYRSIKRWELGGRETYRELIMELLDTAQTVVESGLYQALPDYPTENYVKPDRSKYQPLAEGKAAPEMEGYFLKDSSHFDLKDHLNSPLILVDFWYQSCAPCIQAIPYLDSLEHEFADRGLLLLEVNSRDHKTPQAELIHFLKQRGGKPDNVVMTDPDTEKKLWSSHANPTFYLIKDEKIVWTQQGFAPHLMSKFREKIEEFLEE